MTYLVDLRVVQKLFSKRKLGSMIEHLTLKILYLSNIFKKWSMTFILYLDTIDLNDNLSRNFPFISSLSFTELSQIKIKKKYSFKNETFER